MEKDLENIEIQTTFNEANMEELLGDATIENNVNEDNIEEVENAD